MGEFVFFALCGIVAAWLYKHSKTYRKWVDDPFGEE